MRRLSLVLALILGGAAAAPAPAGAAAGAASATFRLYGSGYGHGIGMSQWGAYGMARMGWSHTQILTHFYTGTAVQNTVRLPRRIRVGITRGVRTIHLTASSGRVSLWVGAPLTGTRVGSIPQGATWSVGSAGDGSFVVRKASGLPVGGRRWGSATENLYVTYQDAGARVTVREADPYGSGYTYARGQLEFNVYGCGGTRCFERLILSIGFEAYLLGIAEVPSSWPAEALAAQVVASRTYALFDLRRDGLRPGCNCHIEDGGNDQTYVGWSKESGPGGDLWSAAVAATRHEVVTYQGAPIQSFFAASDGGHSENVEDAWHGGDPRYAIPYLRGVCDPGENAPANPWVSWNYSYSAQDATARLLPFTGPIGTLTGFDNAVRGVSGRIVTVAAVGTIGRASLTGSQLRAAFGLPDDRVWFDGDRNIAGPIRTAYDALDCRPGLPASTTLLVTGGSRQLFDRGGIYENTNAGVILWLRGPFFDEYVAAGEVTGALGLPLGGAIALSTPGCGSCREVDFEGGREYSSPSGTHALWGGVLDAYLAAGGPAGALGYPTERVQVGSDGSTSATFEGGTVSCPAAGSCSVT